MVHTKPDLVVITDDSTKAEIAEALTYLSHAAQREFPKVGNYLAPTPWDRRHQTINAMLEDWERAPS